MTNFELWTITFAHFCTLGSSKSHFAFTELNSQVLQIHLLISESVAWQKSDTSIFFIVAGPVMVLVIVMVMLMTTAMMTVKVVAGRVVVVLVAVAIIH